MASGIILEHFFICEGKHFQSLEHDRDPNHAKEARN